ncbi:hypothetical protein NDU88_001840 [Pleurodeles waltl]|uniref:Uncharacterized protein n=1 Tax=Pleurodeles waltl TaxID=8319 RepID=A0AAV7Q7Z8_PLEWA|nr:hypothetical protein NDU88_001840 [Pleurodeles waltl]
MSVTARRGEFVPPNVNQTSACCHSGYCSSSSRELPGETTRTIHCSASESGSPASWPVSLCHSSSAPCDFRCSKWSLAWVFSALHTVLVSYYNYRQRSNPPLFGDGTGVLSFIFFNLALGISITSGTGGIRPGSSLLYGHRPVIVFDRRTATYCHNLSSPEEAHLYRAKRVGCFLNLTLLQLLYIN